MLLHDEFKRAYFSPRSIAEIKLKMNFSIYLIFPVIKMFLHLPVIFQSPAYFLIPNPRLTNYRVLAFFGMTATAQKLARLVPQVLSERFVAPAGG